MDFNFSEGVNSALGILGTWFAVPWGYTWAKLLLSIRIEGKPKSYSKIGVSITVLLCLLASLLFGFAVSLLFNSNSSGVSAFIVISVCSLVATYSSYKQYKK